MEYDIAAMKSEYVGQHFDEVDFDVDGETMAEYAIACGETAPHYTDVAAPDFRAVPNFPSKFHGRRQVPKGFPVDLMASFDAGKAVEARGLIRAGDKLTARSHIHDIYEKTGRSGGMLFIVHRMEFTNQNGELVSVVDWRLVVRLDMHRREGSEK